MPPRALMKYKKLMLCLQTFNTNLVPIVNYKLAIFDVFLYFAESSPYYNTIYVVLCKIDVNLLFVFVWTAIMVIPLVGRPSHFSLVINVFQRLCRLSKTAEEPYL